MNLVGSDGVTVTAEALVREVARESVAEWLASEERREEIQDIIGTVVRQVGGLLFDLRSGIVAEIEEASASLPSTLLLEIKRARRTVYELEEDLRDETCSRTAVLRRALARVDATLHRVEFSIVRDSGPASES